MRALAAWREHDVARAIHAHDRDAITASEAARALVLELLARPVPRESAGGARDLYNACARLGRLLAERGASPSLAVSTLDGAARALAETGVNVDPALLPPARASVAEGYFAHIVETERAAARRAWEWPACAVRLDRTTAAVACGYPADDVETLADWAARVAVAASKDGVRRVVVAAGPEAARAELESALALLGIEVHRHLDAHLEAPRARWLRLPWRK